MAPLRGGAGHREAWVTVGEATQHAVGVDDLAVVERHAKRCLARQALQAVHGVGHRHARVVGAAVDTVVPARAGALSARQQAGIGMQHDLVVLVRQGLEDLARQYTRFSPTTSHILKALGLCLLGFLFTSRLARKEKSDGP